MDAPAQTSFTYKLTEPQQALLSALLRSGNYKPVSVPYTVVAAETPDCRINLYTSGKCLVQGKGAGDFVTFVLEPKVLQEARLGYEKFHNPEAFAPHMGIDESGKGDFFGPLVVASAYVNTEIVKELQAMGVKDSKRISSDKKAIELAQDIQKLLGRKYSTVTIGPEAYNRLYSKMGNLNSMLAWGHARAIENLLEIVPDCPRAISDQFGNKTQVERALMKKGRGITLEQMHRAESDMAVAAASIIARATFLKAIEKMGKEYSIKIPKGASQAVSDTALDIIKKQGSATLVKTVKCHFKTTDQVLSAAGLTRSVLGEYGQAVSKPFTFKKSRQIPKKG